MCRAIANVWFNILFHMTNMVYVTHLTTSLPTKISIELVISLSKAMTQGCQFLRHDDHELR